MKGVYQYKCKVKKGAYSATPYGDMAEGMPECSGSTMAELEAAMVAACDEKSVSNGVGRGLGCVGGAGRGRGACSVALPSHDRMLTGRPMRGSCERPTWAVVICGSSGD